MSGNPTKTTNQESYFLDTCIYINYGLTFGTFHDECVCFFNSDAKKFTSKTVIDEIEGFKNFMSRFSRDLSVALSWNKVKTILRTPFSYFRGYNENQESVITNFLSVIKSRKPEDVITQYRAFKRLTIEQIKEALEKNEDSDIPVSKDVTFIKKLNYVDDDGDSQIIADAVLWASKSHQKKFCTSDKKHILNNITELVRDISNHYGRNCLLFLHVTDA